MQKCFQSFEFWNNEENYIEKSKRRITIWQKHKNDIQDSQQNKQIECNVMKIDGHSQLNYLIWGDVVFKQPNKTYVYK